MRIDEEAKNKIIDELKNSFGTWNGDLVSGAEENLETLAYLTSVVEKIPVIDGETPLTGPIAEHAQKLAYRNVAMSVLNDMQTGMDAYWDSLLRKAEDLYRDNLRGEGLSAAKNILDELRKKYGAV